MAQADEQVEMMSSLAEVCHRFETNDPPITYYLDIWFHVGGAIFSVRDGLRGSRDFDLSRHSDDYNDVSSWRRIGGSIANNSEITILNLAVENRPGAIVPAGVFFDELKNNTSAKVLRLNPRIIPSFDLAFFLRHNPNIGCLSIDSEDEQDQVSLEQATIISSALQGVQLNELFRLEIETANFRDNGAFEQILSACRGVELLKVRCDTNNMFTALATLLRDPRAIVHQLDVWYSYTSSNFDGILARREMAASLVGNTKLTVLEFHDCSQHVVDEFDTLLCNTSSLENLCNSNHIIENIELYKDRSRTTNGMLSTFAIECLKLNWYEDKNVVIQNKIMQFYFIGDFDLAPFSVMPVSVLAEVMSLGEMSNKQTTIFELLRGIPELCNVSSRCANLDQDNTFDTHCDKKQKNGSSIVGF